MEVSSFGRFAPQALSTFPSRMVSLKPAFLEARSLKSLQSDQYRCAFILSLPVPREHCLWRLPPSRPWSHRTGPEFTSFQSLLHLSLFLLHSIIPSIDSFNKQVFIERCYLPLIPQNPGTLRHHRLLRPPVIPPKFASMPAPLYLCKLPPSANLPYSSL